MPPTPILFSPVGDVLARILIKAAEAGSIKGLLSNFRNEDIISLQHADDTIIFSDRPYPSPKSEVHSSVV